MKKLQFSILMVFMTFAISWAQITVSLDTISMSQGIQSGYSIDLPGTNTDDLPKVWIKHMKKYKGKKPKLNKSTNEYFSDNVKIKGMSNNTVDVYAIFAPVQGGTRLLVLYDLGGSFLSQEKHGAAAAVGQQIVYDFGVTIKKQQTREKIVNQEKELKIMEKDMTKLSKEEEEIRKSIEDLRAQIAKLEETVNSNKNAQTSQQEAIEKKTAEIKRTKLELENIK